MTKNQKGFTTVEILGAVLVLLLIIAAGTFVYNRSKNKPSANHRAPDATPAESLDTTLTDELSEAARKEQEQAQYAATWMDIDEWGVKIPRGSSLPNAYYSVNDNNNIVATLSSNEFTMSDCQTEEGGIASIIRFTENQADETGSRYKDLYTDAKKVGNYYYGFRKSETGGVCVQKDTNKELDPAPYLTAFKEAVANIQAK